MSPLPPSEWVKLYFTDELKPDEWQLRLMDDLAAGVRRVVGVDYGAGESRTVWGVHVAGRRGGKTAEAERRAGVIRLVEVEPGVWGVRPA